MADMRFRDPTTGATLGTHAYGVVPIGTDSAAWPIELIYKDGQSGSGLWMNELVLEYSEDGGVTRKSDLAMFKLQVTGLVNQSGDPEFAGTLKPSRRTNRLPLAPLRAGCGYTIEISFSHPLVTGAVTTAYTWYLSVRYNESWRSVALTPDAPTGVLSGIGVADVSEWITAPTLTLDTDQVTLGDCAYVHQGLRYEVAGDDYALSQDDGDSVTLAPTEEYVAVFSAGASGITETKGQLATAGTAVAPAFPAGEKPCAVVRVPYGGAIVTSTLLAVSGRCLVTDNGDGTITVHPGRVLLPGMLVTPTVAQILTPSDDATSSVYMSEAGVANFDDDGAPLYDVTKASGLITALVDRRRLLGLEPILISVPGDESVANARASVYIPFPWAADTGGLQARVPSVGATGSTAIDVELDGTGIASGTVAAQATSGALVFTTLSGDPGWLTVDFTAITTSGTRAADFSIVLWVARRA